VNVGSTTAIQIFQQRQEQVNFVAGTVQVQQVQGIFFNVGRIICECAMMMMMMMMMMMVVVVVVTMGGRKGYEPSLMVIMMIMMRKV
jgi:hypothetical protein